MGKSFAIVVLGLGIAAYLLHAARPTFRPASALTPDQAQRDVTRFFDHASFGGHVPWATRHRIGSSTRGAAHAASDAASALGSASTGIDKGAHAASQETPAAEIGPGAAHQAALMNTAPMVLSETEEDVLSMYGDMADALDKTVAEADCNQLGATVEDIVGTNGAALKRWSAERTQLTAEAQTVADLRIEQAAGNELQRLRNSLRVGVTRCPTSDRLQHALVALAHVTEAR